MTPLTRRWAAAAAALIVLCAAAALAWRAFVPDEENLARQVEAAFEARTGQGLVIGQLRWRLFGLPTVELLDARTEQPEPIRVRRIALYPQLLPLLRKQIVIDRLELQGAEVPRNALRAMRDNSTSADQNVVLHNIVFSELSYTSYAVIAVEYEGVIELDEDQLPRRVQIQRPGVTPPATLDATREGRGDAGEHLYQVQTQAAGGTANGQARLRVAEDGGMKLSAELAPRQVEVQALLEAFHRRAFVAGRASGQSTVRAEGQTWGELFRSLRTHSALTVAGGKLLRWDVDKAVKSLGKDHAGQTPLDSLSGTVETQNTEQGMKTEFSEVKAVAGSYSATGRATLYRKRVAAQGQFSIADGAVAVPFALQGPVQQPEIKIAKGAIAGAAIGTAVLPGIGTAIGARIGAAVSGPPEPDKGEPPLPRKRVPR